MKKIVGCIVVLLVFSWVTTANAGPIVTSITDSNGNLTIDGFSSSFGDHNPSTLNFTFDFIPGQSGTVNVFQPVTIGTNYHVHVGFDTTLLAQGGPAPTSPFSADFDIASLFAFAPGSQSVDNILNGLILHQITDFTPSNAFLAVMGDTLQLNSVHVGGIVGNPSLLLVTNVIGGTKLINYLNLLDGSLSRPANGSVTAGFTNAHAEVTVPEPTVFLLLGSGLLVMIGCYKKRA